MSDDAGDSQGTELKTLKRQENTEEENKIPDSTNPSSEKQQQAENKEDDSKETKEDDNKETKEDDDKADKDNKEVKEEPSEETKFLPVGTTSNGADQVAVDVEENDGRCTKMAGGSIMIKIGAAVVVVVAAIITGVCLSALHTIEEGHVGVYYKFGALMDAVTIPGMHYMSPIGTSVKTIMIRSETDQLQGIEAITQDGIQISFEQVQVITRVRQDKVVSLVRKYGVNFKKPLVYDRVMEDIKIFCANNTIDDVYNTRFLDIVQEVKDNIVDSIKRLGEGGIEILNLVIPKPDIPQDIANNYKQVKVQWTEQLVAAQQQKTHAIKKETEQMVAIADANRKKSVLQITIEEKMLEREGERNVSRITNEIQKEREENIANIEKYKIEKAAEANSKLYTKDYIQLNLAKALSNNTKFYFSGENSPLGGLMTKIFNN